MKMPDKKDNPVYRYNVVRKSTVGSSLDADIAEMEPNVVVEVDCEDYAKERADKLNKTVLPEEKELFGTEYSVKEEELKQEEPEHFDVKKAMDDAKVE